MSKQTTDLENELLHTSDIRVYQENNNEEFVTPSLPDYLNQLLISKNMIIADIARASGLDRNYIYQIFSGLKHPPRDKVLALAFGFHLTLEETQDLLKKTGYGALYARVERDSCIIYCFQRHYTLDETNTFLESRGEKQLFYVK